ncbi:MAG: trypsin-like peptidase domain-containing protein [Clostridium sp.]|nr:trypsin-like peptidase domain-containing protein [Clostridium sp.]
MNTVNRDYPYNREQPLEVEWQAPGQNNTGNTQWNGSTYRGTYQNHNQHSGGSGEPPKQKPPKKPVKLWVKIVCGAAACLVISAGSIGGFIGLVNMGAIPFATPGTNSSNSIVNTTKVEKDNTNETSTITGKLTTEEVAQKVIPSVVCIQAYSNTNGYFGTSSESGEGSGIIASSDGYIITNAHVIEGASALKVILSNGTSYEAKIVGSDTATDLALIKIDATDLQAAEFGSSEDLQVGEQVIAIGNPGGIQFNSSVTVGYVSAVNRSITYNGYDMECIQTDAAINPGNSGGALVNMYGQIIGINSAKITATGYEGLGFAIPIDTAQPIINNLKQYGYVKDRAMLGITGQYIDATTARFYGLTQGYSIVKLNSNVSDAGLQKGDIITKIDGNNISSETTVQNVIAKKKPGDTVELEVYRPTTGESITATVTLTEYSPMN